MSNNKELLATMLVFRKSTLGTKFLTDFIKNGHLTTENINSYKSGVAELINEYKVAYEQVDITEREENKQTKIKRRERHISNR